jgi:hypothetical protein
LQVRRYRKGETAESGVSLAPRTIRELDDR